MDVKEHIGVSGTWLFTWHDEAGNILETREEHNLITQSGLNTLAALFIGDIPQDSPIYLALGTGTAAALAGNKKLGVEGFRKALTVKTRQLNEVWLRFFLLINEAINDNWTELGVFLAGTNNPDSGELLNRVLPVGGIRKTNNQTLTVEVRIRFNAA